MRQTVRLRDDERTTTGADVGYAALQYFRKVALLLPLAARFRKTCQQQTPAPWGVPTTFFFHDEGTLAPLPTAENPDILRRVAQQDPEGAAAHSVLADLLDDAINLASNSAEVRHVARVVPGLAQAIQSLIDLPQATLLRNILAIPDDSVVLVINPQENRGVRVLVRGVTSVGQFQIMLALATPSLFPQYELSANVIDAAIEGVLPGAEIPVATIPAQCYRASALTDEGTLPPGFEGSDHWLWEGDALANVPAVKGERVMVCGPVVYPRMWEVVKPFPTVMPKVQLIQTLSTIEVEAWLGRPTRPICAPRIAA